MINYTLCIKLHSVCKIKLCLKNIVILHCVKLYTVFKITHCVWTCTLFVKLHISCLQYQSSFFRVPIGKFYTWLIFLHNQRLWWLWQLSGMVSTWSYIVSNSYLPELSSCSWHELSSFPSRLCKRFCLAKQWKYFTFSSRYPPLSIALWLLFEMPLAKIFW